MANIERLKVLRINSQSKGDNTFTYKINAEMSDGAEKTLVPSSIPIEHNNGLELKEKIEMMLLAAE